MSQKYILLTPLVPDFFALETHDELLEAVSEFGCGLLVLSLVRINHVLRLFKEVWPSVAQDNKQRRTQTVSA